MTMPSPATISLGSLSLSTAHVGAGSSGYELVTWGVTSRRRRRDVETSPYIDGEAEIQSVRDAWQYTLQVRCAGSTWANTKTLMANLVSTIEQDTYTLTETVAGGSTSYTCSAADLDNPLDLPMQVTNRWPATLTIPVKAA